MNWLDLAIICVSLWGGVEGYFRGWWRTFFKTTIIVFAMVLASAFKHNFAVMLVAVFSFEERVKSVISELLVVPVYDGLRKSAVFSVVERIELMINELSLPQVFQKELLENLYQFDPELLELVPEGIFLEEWLTQITINIIAFSLALCLWGGWFNLMETAALFRYHPPMIKQAQRWGGAVLGMGKQFLLISILNGIIGPVLWVYPDFSHAIDFNGSQLANWSLTVFRFCGFWW